MPKNSKPTSKSKATKEKTGPAKSAARPPSIWEVGPFRVDHTPRRLVYADLSNPSKPKLIPVDTLASVGDAVAEEPTRGRKSKR